MARAFNLPETKGNFKASGMVTGKEKDKFFQQTVTKTNKNRNVLKFGVKTSDDNTLYLELSGMVKDEVYFSKKDKDTGKYISKKVKWADRKTFKEEGYKIMGVHVGIEQQTDDKGKLENKKKVLAEFDACEYASVHLKDDMEVFVRGKIEFSSFANDKGDITRMTKFVPNQISRLSSSLDFKAEGFKEQCDFEQTIIFMGIDKDPEDGNRFLIQAKVVTYNSIEDVEFVTTNTKLATTFKKNLKPYNAIKVFGNIVNKALKEEVEQDDAWGEPNPMDQTGNSYIRELTIIGANKETLDTETYTQETVDEALQAIREFGGLSTNTKASSTDDGDWGATEEEEGW